MRWRETVTYYLCLILAISLTGCSRESGKRGEAEKVIIHPASLKVISPATVKDFYQAVGTVASKTSSQTASRVMGHILTIRVKEGDRVKKGDVLIVLESNELKARLDEATNALSAAEKNLKEAEAEQEEAKAQLSLAEITFQRFKDLLERQSVSLQEFDETKAKYEVAKARVRKTDEAAASLEARKRQAEAALNEAKAYHEYTKIRAPFSGIITRKFVHEGDLATPGSNLLTLEDTDHYRMEASVNESQTGKVAIGKEIEITLDRLGEKRIKGKVSEIVPAIDPTTRAFVVKIDLPAIPEIISGMYCKAYFPVEEVSLLLVPRTAIVEAGQLTSLYVVDKNRMVDKRLVTVGKAYGDKVEILSGLNAGESVITSELFKVKEGYLVQTTP
jgi:RND family efflux transporter MFP subunit